MSAFDQIWQFIDEITPKGLRVHSVALNNRLYNTT